MTVAWKLKNRSVGQGQSQQAPRSILEYVVRYFTSTVFKSGIDCIKNDQIIQWTIIFHGAFFYNQRSIFFVFMGLSGCLLNFI